MSRYSIEMDCELLIHEVKKYGELYNPKHASFKNIERREDIWEEIASVVNRPAEECKLKWRGLRDTYVRKIKINKDYVYADQLEFLYPFVGSRTRPKRSSNGYEEIASSQQGTLEEVDEVANDINEEAWVVNDIKDDSEVTNDDTMDFSNIQDVDGTKEYIPSLKLEVSEEFSSQRVTKNNRKRKIKNTWKTQREKQSIASNTKPSSQLNFSSIQLSSDPNSSSNAVWIDDAANRIYVDADKLFFLSLIPSFKRLTEHQKSQTKFRILKLLHDAQFPTAQRESWGGQV